MPKLEDQKLLGDNTEYESPVEKADKKKTKETPHDEAKGDGEEWGFLDEIDAEGKQSWKCPDTYNGRTLSGTTYVFRTPSAPEYARLVPEDRGSLDGTLPMQHNLKLIDPLIANNNLISPVPDFENMNHVELWLLRRAYWLFLVGLSGN